MSFYEEQRKTAEAIFTQLHRDVHVYTLINVMKMEPEDAEIYYALGGRAQPKLIDSIVEDYRESTGNPFKRTEKPS